jgi:hypothetical protein
MQRVQTVPQCLIGVRIEVAIAVQGEAHRGMSGPSGDLGGHHRDRLEPPLGAPPLGPALPRGAPRAVQSSARRCGAWPRPARPSCCRSGPAPDPGRCGLGDARCRSTGLRCQASWRPQRSAGRPRPGPAPCRGTSAGSRVSPGCAPIGWAARNPTRLHRPGGSPLVDLVGGMAGSAARPRRWVPLTGKDHAWLRVQLGVLEVDGFLVLDGKTGLMRLHEPLRDESTIPGGHP